MGGVETAPECLSGEGTCARDGPMEVSAAVAGDFAASLFGSVFERSEAASGYGISGAVSGPGVEAWLAFGVLP